MSSIDRIISGVRQLIEEQYLESANAVARDEYAAMRTEDKTATLKAFLLEQAKVSKESLEWAATFIDRL
jgi:hypothetical protein